MNIVAVIIPIYREELHTFEEISLRRCFQILGSYPIIAIKPKSLNIKDIRSKYDFRDIVDFDDTYFSGIDGYNRLMTSNLFYERFLKYKFILIHQLDAFVFQDSLKEWCLKNYDYIGAPWLSQESHPSRLAELTFRLKQHIYILVNKKSKNTNLPHDKQFRDRVGNGGLSLRNVSKFLDITLNYKSTINYYNENDTKHHFYNEDTFWSIEVNRRFKKLKIPSYKMAVYFAMENGLNRAIKLTSGKLPFGCHDWDNNLEFWRPYFRKVGYIL